MSRGVPYLAGRCLRASPKGVPGGESLEEATNSAENKAGEGRGETSKLEVWENRQGRQMEEEGDQGVSKHGVWRPAYSRKWHSEINLHAGGGRSGWMGQLND